MPEEDGEGGSGLQAGTSLPTWGAEMRLAHLGHSQLGPGHGTRLLPTLLVHALRWTSLPPLWDEETSLKRPVACAQLGNSAEI